MANYIYQHQSDIFENINHIWGSYLNEVQNMKFWIKKRFEWLKTQFYAM
jgi:hypothetical protein